MPNDQNPYNPLDQLYGIVNDLWGSMGKDAAAIEEARKAARDLPKKEEKPAETETAPEETQPEEEKPAFPPFDSFWRVTDETVDWTEALVNRVSPDGLTDTDEWNFLHDHAERVLNGDTAAYVEVLKHSDPLNDLLPYARAFKVKADNADRLSVSFEALPDYMTAEDPEEAKRYLAGITLRAARDLLALLPAVEVAVTARYDDRTVLTVTYNRDELRKVRFQFVDPAAFCRKCGGEFKD